MWIRTSIVLLLVCSLALAEEKKPRVAVLPIAGDAKPAERERVAAAVRAKLERQGVYEPLDKFTSADLVKGKKFDLSTAPEEMIELVADEAPEVIIWGQYDAGELILNVLDTRTSKTRPAVFHQKIDHPTEIRFFVEKLVEEMPGGKPHEHMTEVAVVHDEKAERLWKEGPNLFKEGAFDEPGEWRGILAGDKWAPPVQSEPAKPDGVIIRQSGEQKHLEMRISKATAETYGLACVSGPIKIEPKTRYRIAFRYRSDGPVIRPFIKGYFMHEGHEREIYRRQVPPRGSTNGQWVEVVDELNPQHQAFQPEFLRIDFYIYLHAGTVEFDDVVIKAVGDQTRQAKDEAMDQPVR